jgi:hypothetical protein
MRAFVVRPFGLKESIDFDLVDAQLFAPALAACDLQGGSTAPFLQAGNIRTDVFQQLLAADIVVVDVSIQNADVFYQLGVRHALQPLRTLLLRAKPWKSASRDRGRLDESPFDLRTDRYLEYDPQNPAAQLDSLIEALRQTLASARFDSPVFQVLPNLRAQSRADFIPVPLGFRKDVELAVGAKLRGLLGLLAAEVQDFYWATEGLRLVGRAQFEMKALPEAKETWERLYRLDPSDAEANQRLGTIYQRLGDLDASDRALLRVADDKQASGVERAEALSLLGRNIKERWRSKWSGLTGEEAAVKAADAAELQYAYEKYLQGFLENLDAFYPGLNALSLLTLTIELAKKLPDIWENRFDSEGQAQNELEALDRRRLELAGAVRMALEAAKRRMQSSGWEDRWLDISFADYLFLTGNRPKRVASAYRSALAGAQAFYYASARGQLELFQSLGVLSDNVRAALEVFEPSAEPMGMKSSPGCVLLFTGHMIDPTLASRPRFPSSIENQVQAAIRNAVKQAVDRAEGSVIGIASGASGGDLLFHEVCEELDVEHRLLLPLPADIFRSEAVSPAGPSWENRFDNLLRECPDPPTLSSSLELPQWLSVKKDYTAWQRFNLWLIHEALAVGAKQFALLALWDGVRTEGIGGTYHMRLAAQEYGATILTIYTTDFAMGNPASIASV